MKVRIWMKHLAVLLLLISMFSQAILFASDEKPPMEFVVAPPPTGACWIWARDYSVPLRGRTPIYLWWEDRGYPEYYIVIYETYPDGTIRRYPPVGHFGPYPAPGPRRALVATFIGDVAGMHYLYFQVFHGHGGRVRGLLCTSNTIGINVIRGRSPSTITVSVSPSTIERGGTVRISGTISPRVSTRVTLRIVSPDRGEIIRETTSTAGDFSYTFSPDRVGRWHIQASWAGNEDYVGATSEWASFDVISRKYAVSISTVPDGLPVVVDGVEYRRGMTFNWDEGSSHTLFVQRVIEGEGGVRYVFERWSDGSRSPSRTITVTRHATYEAIFKVQYLVRIQTDVGEAWIEGGEWQDKDSIATARVGSTKYGFDVLSGFKVIPVY